jgi:hypothetical protein
MRAFWEFWIADPKAVAELKANWAYLKAVWRSK